MIVKNTWWKLVFRSCLNESLARDTGTRTTRNPNLSIVTSSTFGYIIVELTYEYTIYQNYNNENRYIWMQSILFRILCIWSSDKQQIWVTTYMYINTTRELKQPPSCWQLPMFTLSECSNIGSTPEENLTRSLWRQLFDVQHLC